MKGDHMPKIPEHAKMRAFHGGYPDEPPHALEPIAAEREGAESVMLRFDLREKPYKELYSLNADGSIRSVDGPAIAAYVASLKARLDLAESALLAARRENETLRDAHRVLWDATSESIGLEWHGCLTGDCPHDHHEQCSTAIREAIAQVAGFATDAQARAAFAATQETP